MTLKASTATETV